MAIDLAGPEAFRPTLEYKKIFEVALNAKLNVIIHAGEACGNESILEAIQIGAKRIGHGVHLSLDEDMIKLVRENNIYFEFCPTSNLQTKSLLTYKDVPLRKFLDNQIGNEAWIYDAIKQTQKEDRKKKKCYKKAAKKAISSSAIRDYIKDKSFKKSVDKQAEECVMDAMKEISEALGKDYSSMDAYTSELLADIANTEMDNVIKKY